MELFLTYDGLYRAECELHSIDRTVRGRIVSIWWRSLGEVGDDPLGRCSDAFEGLFRPNRWVGSEHVTDHLDPHVPRPRSALAT